MDTNLLIILLSVGLVALLVLVRWGLTRLFDKAGNAVDKVIVNAKNARSSGEPIRLADLYPDLYAQIYGGAPPQKQPPAAPQQTSALAESPAPQAETPAPPAPFIRASAAPAAAPEPPAPFIPAPQEEAFPQDRCCLCGRGLENGYAILFTNERGRAVIDKNCSNGIGVLVRGQKPEDVSRAVRYFSALRQQAHPDVAAYMEKYLSAAEEWLNESSQAGGES